MSDIHARPDEARFRAVFNTVEPFIENRYGIPVVITDVADPQTGDLDGASIQVDHAVTAEDAVFIIAHLFGHTVQWCLHPRWREIGSVLHRSPSPELLAELERYEVEACRYSLQLFHEAGIHDLDQWVSDFAGCDWAYLLHLYRTGEKRPFRSFWRDGRPLMEPLAIPPFRPQRWVSRWKDGIVV